MASLLIEGTKYSCPSWFGSEFVITDCSTNKPVTRGEICIAMSTTTDSLKTLYVGDHTTYQDMWPIHSYQAEDAQSWIPKKEITASNLSYFGPYRQLIKQVMTHHNVAHEMVLDHFQVAPFYAWLPSFVPVGDYSHDTYFYFRPCKDPSSSFAAGSTKSSQAGSGR